MNDLIDFRKDVHSQFGEDGIIEKLLEIVGAKNRWCCEIGAWDGVWLSNTRRLIKQGWNAALIEADKEKLAELRKNCTPFPRTVTINQRVKPGEMDDVLEHAGAPVDLDLFSLDVDGDEHAIWEGMKRYEPRLVVVESNYTFPPNVEFVQKKGLDIGNSALSLSLLAKEKGYKLVCFNVINCFFVKEDLFPLEGITPRRLQELFYLGATLQMGIHSSYGGVRFLSGEMPWGRTSLRELPAMKDVARIFKVHLGNDYLALPV